MQQIVLVGLLFPYINDDAQSNSHQVNWLLFVPSLHSVVMLYHYHPHTKIFCRLFISIFLYQVQCSLDFLGPNCLTFHFIRADELKIFFLTLNKREILISLQCNSAVYILLLFYCCTTLYIDILIQSYLHSMH
jgi:hypothetical protein